MAKQYYSLSELRFEEKSKHFNFKDLTGKIFHRLTIIGYAGKGARYDHYWFGQCTCGNIVKASVGCLSSGKTRSCGCWITEIRGQSQKTHGLADTIEYHTYVSMKSRCENPNNKCYQMYGGRGIKVLLSFEEFLLEVGKRPSKNYSIDRIDTNGHYSKGNLRWTTAKNQSRNTRRNRFVLLDGKQVTVAEACEKTGLNDKAIYNRLKKGWCSDHAISVLRGQSRPEDCEICCH